MPNPPISSAALMLLDSNSGAQSTPLTQRRLKTSLRRFAIIFFTVIRPIDSTVRDFDDRLARLEQQHADAAASHMAGTQLLDVRLARLEEHTDTTAIQNL